MDDFKAGHIKRIKVKDFMTYDDVELYPKSGLNLIVGLNGCGKSSIMCAICLGLGGKPQFTGRATQLNDFIKHGRHEATIELELSNSTGRSVVINRSIKNKQSSWCIDSKPSNQNEVLSLVKQLNIDTSNLCQFLPQEKVVEFSKMDKKQRLENMLQSIGEPYLFELFNKLKELRKTYCNYEEKIKQIAVDKAESEQKTERLKPEIEKQNEREQIKAELKMLTDQKKVLEYALYRDMEREKKQLKQKYEANKNKLSKCLENMQVKRDQMMSNCKESQKIVTKLEETCSSLISKLQTRVQNLHDLNGKVHNEKIEYKNRIAEKEAQKKRCEDLKQQIAGLESLHNDLKLQARTDEEHLRAVSQQSSELEVEHSSLTQQLQQIMAEGNKWNYEVLRHEKRLAEMQNEERKMLEKVKSISRPTYEATCWLMDNSHLFKSKVYTPILMQIKVGNAENSKYIENSIPMRDLLAFVCEDKKDAEHLTNVLITQKKLRVNIAMTPDQPMSTFKSPNITQTDRNLGFQSFLKDLFTAPEPVMRYLCRCFNVHRIPVCSSNAETSMDYFLEKFTLFYTPMFKISGRRSKYGQKCWSCMKDRISNKNLLASSENDTLSRQEQMRMEEAKKNLDECQARHKLLSAELQNIEKLIEKYRQEKKELRDRQVKFEKVNSQLQQKKYLLQNIKFVDESSLLHQLVESIQDVNNQRKKLLEEKKKLLSEFLKISVDKVKAIITLNCVMKNVDSERKCLNEIKEELKTATDQYNAADADHRATYVKAKDLLDRIKPILNEVAQHLPKDMEEVEQKIMHTQAKLNLNCEVDDSVLEEYQKRLRDIEKAEGKIDSLEAELKNVQKEIDANRNLWLPPLKRHVTNINKKFSQYFKFLNCAGEISLDTCNDTDDFSKYGLQIKLKYREDEPFTELSQNHHSGGECSVAAIIFILSLQELTEVPFRCIDEINQGMDTVNERKIYQLVSDSASNGSCSQYFLLTPKLLMNLTYPRNIAVHVIYNSCFMDLKINVRKHIKQMSKLKD